MWLLTRNREIEKLYLCTDGFRRYHHHGDWWIPKPHQCTVYSICFASMRWKSNQAQIAGTQSTELRVAGKLRPQNNRMNDRILLTIASRYCTTPRYQAQFLILSTSPAVTDHRFRNIIVSESRYHVAKNLPMDDRMCTWISVDRVLNECLNEIPRVDEDH